jgi:uncharacterized protein YbaR (Trm112 family)
VVISKELLEVLACPQCKGPVELKGEALECANCKLRYRIEDGIPVMLIDEAEQISD